MAPRAPRFLPKGRPFLIAEAGVNHNGRADLALRLVDAAVAAGADAVKFQTFRADALASGSAPQARYQRRAGVSSQRDMLRKLELSEEAHRAVVAHCVRKRIRFMSTPFDEQSADMLERLGMTIFKVPSGEANNFRLLTHIARKRKPLIVSTGMCTLDEVRAAVRVVGQAGCAELALLHCVSSYPAPPADANIRAMQTMAEACPGIPIGYSDHTQGVHVAVAAAALGARVIEKHFTLDKTLPGPDHAMSLSPGELKTLAACLREACASLGDGVKKPRPCELEIKRVARRSVVLARDLPAGATLAEGDVVLKRPATGIHADQIERVVGRRLKKARRADTVLRWEMLA